jgi:hypothetical protein
MRSVSFERGNLLITIERFNKCIIADALTENRGAIRVTNESPALRRLPSKAFEPLRPAQLRLARQNGYSPSPICGHRSSAANLQALAES